MYPKSTKGNLSKYLILTLRIFKRPNNECVLWQGINVKALEHLTLKPHLNMRAKEADKNIRIFCKLWELFVSTFVNICCQKKKSLSF